MAKKLEAELKISGELDASLRKAIASAEQNMDQLTNAARQGEGAMGALNAMVKKQGQTLKAAQTQYASFVLNGDEASAEARDLAQGIADLTANLNQNKAALKAAEQAAKGLADGLDSAGNRAGDVDGQLGETGNAARRSGHDLDLLKGAAGAVATAGFAVLVSGAKDAVQALWSLSEQTRVFRQDMGALETAYQQTNFSAEQAQSTYTDLYAVFGEDDRAVETANNIARMAQSQTDLDKWVKITTGTWGTYQDALPVENLAEAAGETAKTGKVTGGLADALNWSTEAAEMFSSYMGGDVVTAEDAFNKALSECTNEEERQQLITDTLLTLYGDAADEYEKATGSLMDANRAAAEAQKAQADLGEAIEPATTAWTQLKTQLMEAVTPALTVVADKVAGVIEWLQQHPALINAIVVAIGVLAGAIVVITGAVAVFTAVQMAANLSLLPVIGIALLIAAAIAAVIGIGYLLISNWDTIKAKATEIWGHIQAVWNSIKTAVAEAVSNVVTTVTEKWTALKATVSAIWNGIKDAISSIWNSIKSKARSFANGVVNTIRNSWNALTGILTAPFNAVFGVINSVSSAIDNLISKASGGGGSVSSLLTSWLPGFASGGFTDGVSIAGEAGTEAVLSFDPRYRADNLRYWAQAGRMLGASESDYTLSTPRSAGSSTVVGDIHFEPQITIAGDAKKQDIIDAIRETYPEFIDLVEEVLEDRKVGAYA